MDTVCSKAECNSTGCLPGREDSDRVLLWSTMILVLYTLLDPLYFFLEKFPTSQHVHVDTEVLSVGRGALQPHVARHVRSKDFFRLISALYIP